MSANELRQAAARLHLRATAAFDASDQTEWWNADGLADAMYMVDENPPKGIEEDSEHLATYTPAVGIALADWLDAEAEHVESHDCELHCAYPDGDRRCKAALAVARYINGGA